MNSGMLGNNGCRLIAGLAMIMAFLAGGSRADAATVHWTDWISPTTTGGVFGDFTATGQITTTTATVGVTYHNPTGIAFYQNGSGTDYFAQGGSGSLGRNPATSPYTSALVDNIPTASEMIALRYAGTQTLTFSETIAHPVFSYVSLNLNGYAFDQDFEILSYGDGTASSATPAPPPGGNDIGWWGVGTSTKSVVTVNGVTEYQLLGTGEPHGTIRFTGAFDTVTWRSLTSENWNGFTVGIAGTAEEILPHGVPLPSSLGMLGLGLFGLLLGRRLRSRR